MGQKRKYTKRAPKLEETPETQDQEELEDIFIDDEIQMQVPKNQIVQKSFLRDIKSEPLECLEDQSTTMGNEQIFDQKDSIMDLVEIISNIKPSQHPIKHEPCSETGLPFLNQLLACSERDLNRKLQEGSLAKVYSHFNEVLSQPARENAQDL